MAAEGDDTVAPAGGSNTSWMEQTIYIARTIYEDPTIGPINMDLHSACAMGKFDCVSDAINRKDNLSVRNKGGWTPLMYASYVGHDTVVNLLLDAHVDPNIGTPTGLTPLMVAAGCGNESVCYFLIQNGAKIDQQDDRGWTALYHATKQGHQATVQLLLKEGANMEIGDYAMGYTPLMIAAMEGDQIVLDVLIACQADIDAKAKDGHTARSLALYHNHIKTVSFLDEVRMIYRGRVESNDSFESDIPSVSSYPDTDDDVQSGPDEVDHRAIQKKLGKRAGPRWSLPPEHMGPRASITNATTTRRLKFRPTRSLPESDAMASSYIEEYEDTLCNSTHSQEDTMAKLMEFLEEIGLQRYYEVFESNEIDFYALLELSDEELKKLVDKLGPRKKLKVAIANVKEEIQAQEAEAVKVMQRVATPTPESEMRSQLNLLQIKHQQALQNMESCERRLTKEHELRIIAERYCNELQQCRAHALEANKVLRDTMSDIIRHCQSLSTAYLKLSNEVKGSGCGDRVWSSLGQLEGVIQAVHRSSHQANKDCKAVQYQLNVISS